MRFTIAILAISIAASFPQITEQIDKSAAFLGIGIVLCIAQDAMEVFRHG
jgi:hypothetical protein